MEAYHIIFFPVYIVWPVHRGFYSNYWIQYAQSHQRQCHHEALGYWRTTTFQKHVGEILSRCKRYSVRPALLAFCYTIIWRRLFLYRFVVDAADHDKLPAAHTELKNLLDKPQLANIPVLVLGNKNDLPNALAAEQLIDALWVQNVIAKLLGVEKLTAVDFRHLKSITNREVSCYSISAKNQVNIDVTLQWLIKKGKGQK